MDLSERSRLEKLLGMLGSSFDGERANAARMISAMAEKQRKTIVELIYGANPPRQTPNYGPKPAAKPRSNNRVNTRAILDALLQISLTEDEWEFTLTQWECKFASDVATRYENDYELSEKQIPIAERIIAKVETARERNRGGA